MEQNKPRHFVGSSTGSLAVAHALRENLEYHIEVRVWNQGIFDFSASTLSSLLEAISETDFGAFVLAADDLAEIRKEVRRVPRDNVVFELGLFIGGLGRDRTFIVAPRGIADFAAPDGPPRHHARDLRPESARWEPSRSPWPAATKIKTAVSRLGPMETDATDPSANPAAAFDDNDCLSILESWLGGRPSGDNTQAMVFTEVDRPARPPAWISGHPLRAGGQEVELRREAPSANTIMFSDRGGGGCGS